MTSSERCQARPIFFVCSTLDVSGWTLQQTPSLTSTNWSASSGVTLSNGTNSLTWFAGGKSVFQADASVTARLIRTLMKSSTRNLVLASLAVIILRIMFWLGKKHDKIRVEFVENGKDKSFAVSMVPIEQLPDSFEVATTLDILGKKWSVVDATPKQKTDFEKSGKLKVVLSQLQTVNPKDILFSLPTINDRICVYKKQNRWTACLSSMKTTGGRLSSCQMNC